MSRLSSATVLVALASARTAGAVTFNVDRADDPATVMACADGTPNDCSLRGAILAANALSGPTTIVVPAGNYLLTRSTSCSHVTTQFGTNSVTTTALCVQKPVSIVGAGAGATIIDGNQTGPVILAGGAGPIEIRGATIRNGRFDGGSTWGHGGAINNASSLTVTDCEVSDNWSNASGGGIYNSNSLTVRRSTLARNVCGANSGTGGAIYNASQNARAVTNVFDSTIAFNQAHSGGGISIYGGDVSIAASTIRDNVAYGSAGGGIYVGGSNFLPVTTVVNSTISGNANRWSYGGGLYASRGATTLRNVTVTGNVAGLGGTNGIGGGIVNQEGATLTIANTLVAGNTATWFGRDCYDGGRASTITSLGYNLVGFVDAECTISGDATGNVTNVDARLSLLGDFGGPTSTHALIGDSPAIDAGDPAGCKGSAGSVLSLDQRGFNRPLDGLGTGLARCDIGAFEFVPELQVVAVAPNRGGSGGRVVVRVSGAGFREGTVVRLERPGRASIVGSEALVSDAEIAAQFDLVGAEPGAWDVVAVVPGGAQARLRGGFSVEDAGFVDLLVDRMGRGRIRGGQPSRYRVEVSNRGNADAYAVPVILSVDQGFRIEPRFDVSPPPSMPGTEDVDWTKVPVLSEGAPGESMMTLLFPIVPMGTTSSLEFAVTGPLGDARTSVQIVGLDGPIFLPDALPSRVDDIVGGARAFAQRALGVSIPQSRVPAMREQFGESLGEAIRAGRRRFMEDRGAHPLVYSLPQWIVDLSLFGASAGSAGGASSEAIGTGERPRRAGLGRGSHAAVDGDRLAQPTETRPGAVSKLECLEMMGRIEDTNKDGAADRCIPRWCKNNPLASGNGGPFATGFGKLIGKLGFPDVPVTPGDGCGGWPITSTGSQDPNDKAGRPGSGAEHWTTADGEFRYVIFFENVATASAPAQVVSIVDQLDATRLDLDSLSLGAISFGSDSISPPPGVSSFVGDVDLRPSRPMIVRVEASLDKGTGLLRWQFSSVDPATGQPLDPSDPDGFLPPNVKAPEGDGAVNFSVRAKSVVATGDEIRNQASITFDANPFILTPQWVNTVDRDAPDSSLTSAVPVSPCARSVALAWDGTDLGSGVSTYDVWVSEDGGPLAPGPVGGTGKSATFLGKWGHTYGFAAVASDRAGNTERLPTTPEVSLALDDCGPHDLAIAKILAPKAVGLSGSSPRRTKRIGVQIQNRGTKSVAIGEMADLARLVSLEVASLGTCTAVTPVLTLGRPQKSLPLELGPKKKLNVFFDAEFECANDPVKGTGHEDFRVMARVNLAAALGGLDAHPADDACPRSAPATPTVDPYPDGRLREIGCGSKRADGSLGGDVLVDVSLR